MKTPQQLKAKYEGKYFEKISKFKVNIVEIFFVKEVEFRDEEDIFKGVWYCFDYSKLDEFEVISFKEFETFDVLYLPKQSKITEITKEAFEAKLNEALEKIKNYQNQ